MELHLVRHGPDRLERRAAHPGPARLQARRVSAASRPARSSRCSARSTSAPSTAAPAGARVETLALAMTTLPAHVDHRDELRGDPARRLAGPALERGGARGPGDGRRRCARSTGRSTWREPSPTRSCSGAASRRSSASSRSAPPETVLVVSHGAPAQERAGTLHRARAVRAALAALAAELRPQRSRRDRRAPGGDQRRRACRARRRLGPRSPEHLLHDLNGHSTPMTSDPVTDPADNTRHKREVHLRARRAGGRRGSGAPRQPEGASRGRAPLARLRAARRARRRRRR